MKIRAIVAFVLAAIVAAVLIGPATAQTTRQPGKIATPTAPSPAHPSPGFRIHATIHKPFKTVADEADPECDWWGQTYTDNGAVHSTSRGECYDYPIQDWTQTSTLNPGGSWPTAYYHTSEYNWQSPEVPVGPNVTVYWYWTQFITLDPGTTWGSVTNPDICRIINNGQTIYCQYTGQWIPFIQLPATATPVPPTPTPMPTATPLPTVYEDCPQSIYAVVLAVPIGVPAQPIAPIYESYVLAPPFEFRGYFERDIIVRNLTDDDNVPTIYRSITIPITPPLSGPDFGQVDLYQPPQYYIGYGSIVISVRAVVELNAGGHICVMTGSKYIYNQRP